MLIVNYFIARGRNISEIEGVPFSTMKKNKCRKVTSSVGFTFIFSGGYTLLNNLRNETTKRCGLLHLTVNVFVLDKDKLYLDITLSV